MCRSGSFAGESVQPKTDLLALRRRLEDALMTLATLVAEDSVYLPLFQRVEAELAALDKQESALDRAIALARRQSATR